MSYLMWMMIVGLLCIAGGVVALFQDRFNLFASVMLIGMVALYTGSIFANHFPDPDKDNRRCASYNALWADGYEQALKDLSIPGWVEDDLRLVPIKDQDDEE